MSEQLPKAVEVVLLVLIPLLWGLGINAGFDLLRRRFLRRTHEKREDVK